MIKADFAGHEFEAAGVVPIERDDEGQLIEYTPGPAKGAAATTPLHRYGGGPFCYIHFSNLPSNSCVYLITVNGVPVYVGETVNLARMWGRTGYGGVSPADRHAKGQPTVCRINSNLLAHTKKEELCELWYRLEADPHPTKRSIARKLHPIWNASIPR